MIMSCSCEHKFQDKRYGKFIRVFNQTVNKTTYRCTVCEKQKEGRGKK